MDVVLYDTEHFETLETLVHLLHDGQRRLHLVVPDTVRGELEAAGIAAGKHLSWHPLPEAPAGHARTLARVLRESKASLLLLATVSFRHYAFARLVRKLRRVRVLLGVHDLTDTFNPAPARGIRAAVRRWGLKQLRASVAGFLVLLPELRTEIRRRRLTDKPVYVVPGRLFFEEGYRSAAATPLRVVVPGSIDPRRRDYESVRKLAERIARHPASVQVALVGAVAEPAYTPGWLAQYPGIVEIRSGRPLPSALFAGALSEAALLWAPLPERFSAEGRADETYGLTKSSGTFYDAVSAGKPLLLPASASVPEHLLTCTLQYIDEEHLYYLLIALQANEAAFQRLQADALTMARRFSVEVLRPRIVAQLTGGR